MAIQTGSGVTLRADIYRPKADGKFPVLLERTPYDKSGGRDFGVRGAAHGYVVVIQDTRGRYASEGEWYTFKNESNDGFDSVEWAAALPYADGKVGMFGGSYVGATQFLAAAQPDIYVKGGDYTLETLDQEERRTVEQAKGRIVIIPFVPGKSTTALLKKIAGL